LDVRGIPFAPPSRLPLGGRPRLDQSGSAKIERTVAKVINSVIGCNGDSTNPRDR
jgi:hypothetical protein